jgi:threonine aldolase
MYEAMSRARLGDDVLGDDPTVRELEELAAETVGHQAGLFLPSGTMSNQAAIATWVRPGDAVLADPDAHVAYYEGGAPAVIARALLRPVSAPGGVVTPEELERAHTERSEHTPKAALLVVENSHNRHGGAVTSDRAMDALRATADRLGVRIHLDGARLFNAAVAQGLPAKALASPADSVNFCLSKGLCAPVGSMLCGPSGFVGEARFWRKRLGGGMRQSGLLAACGIVALKTMVDRLAEDHENARLLAAMAEGLPGVRPRAPATNIVLVEVAGEATAWQSSLAERGVRCLPVGRSVLRFVTHREVDRRGVEHAAASLRAVAAELA